MTTPAKALCVLRESSPYWLVMREQGCQQLAFLGHFSVSASLSTCGAGMQQLSLVGCTRQLVSLLVSRRGL